MLPRGSGHSATCVGIFSVTLAELGGGGQGTTTDILWVEARKAAEERLQYTGQQVTKRHPASNINRAEIKKPFRKLVFSPEYEEMSP